MLLQFLESCLYLLGHPGVDDVVEALAGLRVGEDQFRHLRPVEFAVRPKILRPEKPSQLLPGGRAHGHGVMGRGVGVQVGRPQLPEHPGHGALARPGPTSDGDFEH